MNISSPDYEIRISTKARHPQIRIIPPDRVEVVLPRGMPQSIATQLVTSKSNWIQNKLALFANLQASHTESLDNEVFPEHINLPAIDRRLRIEYRSTRSTGVRAIHRDHTLHLSGAVDDAERVQASLKRWVLATARSELPHMLQELAARHRFSYQKLSVRNQRHRWGSCSAHRHIVLNAKLLCLPRRLARHVMLHELAHLRHLNHSRSFWALLQQLDENAKHHHSELRTAWLHMPAWLEAG